jgi:DNA-binding transcriptional LysR family regulator
MALVDPDPLDRLEGVRLLEEELVVIAALDHPLAQVVAEANELETVRELTARGLPFSMIWRTGERPTPAAQAFRAHVLDTISASTT